MVRISVWTREARAIEAHAFLGLRNKTFLPELSAYLAERFKTRSLVR
jgi:hypothetical protein